MGGGGGYSEPLTSAKRKKQNKKKALTFVEQTQRGEVRTVRVLEKEGLAVQRIDGEMISARNIPLKHSEAKT